MSVKSEEDEYYFVDSSKSEVKLSNMNRCFARNETCFQLSFSTKKLPPVTGGSLGIIFFYFYCAGMSEYPTFPLPEELTGRSSAL